LGHSALGVLPPFGLSLSKPSFLLLLEVCRQAGHPRLADKPPKTRSRKAAI